jgi:hypothetical protein
MSKYSVTEKTQKGALAWNILMLKMLLYKGANGMKP